LLLLLKLPRTVLAATRRSLLGLLLLAGAGACNQTPPSEAADDHSMTAYDRMLGLLYKQTVPTIQPAELAEQLRQHPEGVVLLDTRSPEEYQVSHLRGAQFVNYDGFETATFDGVPRDAPVVVYCSVGARSEKVGERLRALGFRDVRNLYGGIFQWVNEGHAVYNQAGITTQVHPYSALWRPWLRRGEPVYK
jgi:rhodanese-related sulfurtransferase